MTGYKNSVFTSFSRIHKSNLRQVNQLIKQEQYTHHLVAEVDRNISYQFITFTSTVSRSFFHTHIYCWKDYSINII